MPAIITPFDATGEIDRAAHRHNVGVLWERGIAGVVIGGSNGEGPYLEPGERAMLAADARAAAPEGFVMVGIASESLRGAVGAAAEAATAGADAVLAMTPTTLVRHRLDLVEGFYADLADASPLPVFLYSVPRVTAYELAMDAAIRLAGHDNIVGMKDSGGDVTRCVTIAGAAGPSFWMFAGASAAAGPAVAGGVHGAITASANYAPGLIASVVSSAGTAAAAAPQETLRQVSGAVESLGVAAVKYAATRTGLEGGHTRRPLRPLSDDERTRVDAALVAAGLL